MEKQKFKQKALKESTIEVTMDRNEGNSKAGSGTSEEGSLASRSGDQAIKGGQNLMITLPTPSQTPTECRQRRVRKAPLKFRDYIE